MHIYIHIYVYICIYIYIHILSLYIYISLLSPKESPLSPEVQRKTINRDYIGPKYTGKQPKHGSFFASYLLVDVLE